MNIQQFHADLDVKEFIAKEGPGFRLRVRTWKCIAPDDCNSLEFIQESLDDKGEVVQSSTYSFFLSNEEVQTLAYSLANINNPINKLD